MDFVFVDIILKRRDIAAVTIAAGAAAGCNGAVGKFSYGSLLVIFFVTPILRY